MAFEPLLVEPSDSEIDEWAARERQKRAAWLEGPTQEQKIAWAGRERERRLAELAEGLGVRVAAERARLSQHYGCDA